MGLKISSKRSINSILKDKQVPDLMNDLSLNKDDILKNIKKNLNQAHFFPECKGF